MNMMKKFGVVAAIALTAVSANGEAVDRCYGRMYSREHMIEHPNQSVAAITMHIHKDNLSYYYPDSADLQIVASAKPEFVASGIAGQVFDDFDHPCSPIKDALASELDLKKDEYNFIQERSKLAKYENAWVCRGSDGGCVNDSMFIVSGAFSNMDSIEIEAFRLTSVRGQTTGFGKCSDSSTTYFNDTKNGAPVATSFKLYKIDPSACEGVGGIFED